MLGGLGGSGAAGEETPLPPPVPEGQAIPLGVQPIRWYQHTRASLILLVLILLAGSIVYPLIVTGFAQLVVPSTASGQQWAKYNQTEPTSNQTNSSAVLGLDNPTTLGPSHPLSAREAAEGGSLRVRTLPRGIFWPATVGSWGESRGALSSPGQWGEGR